MALVRDPRTGLMVEVPDNNPAALLQTAAAQPIAGPSRITPNDTLERLTTGALGLPVALGRDVINQLGTRASNVARGALGAEPLPLPGLARTSKLAEQVSAAAGEFGQMNQNLAASVRAGLGWEPAAQPPAAVAPVAAPTIAPVTAAAPQPVAPVASPALLTANDLTGINATIAQNLQSLRPEQGVMQPAVRGDYNMTNTPRGTGAPANNGINFGFGVNGAPTARETLDRFAAQDAQDAQTARQNRLLQQIDLIQSGITERSSVGERAAARSQLAVLQPLAAQAMQNTAGLADRAAQGVAARQTQELANLGAVEAAQVTGQARAVGAQAAAQGTVAAAQARAQGLIDQERLRQQSPEQQRAAAETQLLDLQTQAALELLASGAPAQDVVAATRRGQPQAPTPYVADPMGIPLYRVAPDGTIQLVDPADAARVRAIANPRAGQ